jgi:hypothetical protein
MAAAGAPGKAIALRGVAAHNGSTPISGSMMAKASISRAWDETRAIVSRDGGLFGAVALALLVLPGLVGDLVIPPKKGEGLAQLASASGPRLAGMFLIFVIALIGQLAIIRLSVGGRLTVGGAIAHAARRAPAYIAACALWMLPFFLIAVGITGIVQEGETPSPPAALMGLIGILVLLVGGSIVFVRMLMTAPVASNEDVSPLGVMRRSWDLTRGNWLRLFGFFLLFFVAVVILMAAVGAVAGSVARVTLGELDPMTLGAFLVSLVMQLVGAALSVMFSVMLARIYVQFVSVDHAAVSVPDSGD